MKNKLYVEEFTSPCPVTVDPNSTIQQVDQMMREHGIRHVPVVEKTIPVGIVSDRDIKMAKRYKDWFDIKIKEIMVSDLFSVSPETNIDVVALEMSERKIGSALVQDNDGSIIGIFTSTDALNALVEVVRGEV